VEFARANPKWWLAHFICGIRLFINDPTLRDGLCDENGQKHFTPVLYYIFQNNGRYA
jgi:hypothetical protein